MEQLQRLLNQPPNEATAKLDGGVANACIHVSKVLWEEEREAASRLVDEAMRDSFHELLGKRVR